MKLIDAQKAAIAADIIKAARDCRKLMGTSTTPVILVSHDGNFAEVVLTYGQARDFLGTVETDAKAELKRLGVEE